MIVITLLQLVQPNIGVHVCIAAIVKLTPWVDESGQ